MYGFTSIRFGIGLTIALLCLSNIARAQLVTNNGASVKTCTGSIVQVNGSVHNASGTYDNTGTTTITGNCTNEGTIGDSGRINLAGDWINNNIFNRYIGLVVMNGTAQRFSGTKVTTFHDLTILGGNVKTCDTNEIVDDTMNFTNGVVSTTQPHLLTFTINGGWKNGSSASYVNGPCGKDFNTTNEFTYPVGKQARFNKCGIIPSASTASTFRCEYFDTAYANTTSTDTTLKHVSKSQYWHCDRTSGSVNGKVRLYWIHGDYPPSAIAKISDLKVGRWTGTLWTSEGVTYVAGSYDTGNIVSKYCTTWGLSPNEPFTVCSDSSSTALPVELDHFAAVQVGSHVHLDWLTRSESQNLGYEIERSSNGETPKLIKSWQTDTALMAKSSYGSAYATMDDPKSDGLYTYDLYQRDADGARWHSASQTLLFKQVPDAAQIAMELFPNPATTHAQMRIGLIEDAASVTVQIFDAAGRKVSDQNLGSLSVGFHSLALSDVAHLPSGSYTVVVNACSLRISKSLILNK